MGELLAMFVGAYLIFYGALSITAYVLERGWK